MLPAALHPAVEGTPIRGIALIRRQSLRNLAYQTLAPATPRRTLPLFPIPTFLSGASYTAAPTSMPLRTYALTPVGDP